MLKDETFVKGKDICADFCWYRVVYTIPYEDSPVYIVYVCAAPDASEDSIRSAIYRQIYRFSDSLLGKGFPIEIKSIACVDKAYKAD